MITDLLKSFAIGVVAALLMGSALFNTAVISVKVFPGEQPNTFPIGFVLGGLSVIALTIKLVKP